MLPEEVCEYCYGYCGDAEIPMIMKSVEFLASSSFARTMSSWRHGTKLEQRTSVSWRSWAVQMR